MKLGNYSSVQGLQSHSCTDTSPSPWGVEWSGSGSGYKTSVEKTLDLGTIFSAHTLYVPYQDEVICSNTSYTVFYS